MYHDLVIDISELIRGRLYVIFIRCTSSSHNYRILHQIEQLARL